MRVSFENKLPLRTHPTINTWCRYILCAINNLYFYIFPFTYLLLTFSLYYYSTLLSYSVLIITSTLPCAILTSGLHASTVTWCLPTNQDYMKGGTKRPAGLDGFNTVSLPWPHVANGNLGAEMEVINQTLATITQSFVYQYSIIF